VKDSDSKEIQSEKLEFVTESKRAESIEKKLEESFEDLGKLEHGDASEETGNDKLVEALEDLAAEEEVERDKAPEETSTTQGDTRKEDSSKASQLEKASMDDSRKIESNESWNQDEEEASAPCEGRIESSDQTLDPETPRRLGEIRSLDELDEALKQCAEWRIQKGFENDYQEAKVYFESEEVPDREKAADEGVDSAGPKLVENMETREQRRRFEEDHGGPPEVSIKSMNDVNKLIVKHPDVKRGKKFETMCGHCETYFEVKDDWSKTREELSRIHAICHTYVGNWRAGKEPTMISNLRRREEERIIREWAANQSEIESIKPQTVDDASDLRRANSEAVHKISSEVVHQSLGGIGESKSWKEREVGASIESMYRNQMNERQHIYIADLPKDSGWNQTQLRDFEKYIQTNQRSLEKSLAAINLPEGVQNPRILMTDGRLYVWTPKLRTDELLNAYEKQFFYFQDNGGVARLVEDLQRQLQLEGSLHKAHGHLNELIRQSIANDSGPPLKASPFHVKGQRVEGRILRFYLDAMGMSLTDLEGRVTRIAGPNGQAGIRNPRFPKGEELEISMARLTASIVSDGHLRESGRITYLEKNLERIERVRQILTNFGDIKVEGGFRKGVYEIHIPCQIGLALIEWGMTPGDKAIHNPGLSESILNGSERVRGAYLEELIPEDGYFRPSTGFAWNRSHALHAGNKIVDSGFEQRISQDEVSLMQEFGKKSKKLVRRKSISYGALKELQAHEDHGFADAAKKLVQVINRNPNRLIRDECRIAESFGIQVTLLPDQVRYSLATGRVSVRWRASTTSVDDALRWADICPPNDIKKKQAVENWQRKIVEDWLNRKSWMTKL